MIEIKKKFFTPPNRDDDITDVDLFSENACIGVASAYNRYVFKWSGKIIFFINKGMGKEIRDKKLMQIRKLIQISYDLGVTPEIYIKAQFEQRMPYYQKVNLIAVPFAHLISKNAIVKFHEYEKNIEANFTKEGDVRKEVHSVATLNLKKSIEDSIDTVYRRLKKIMEIYSLNEKMVILELEVLVRTASITKIYIYSSPLVGRGKSNELDKIYEYVSKKLNDYEKKEIKYIRSYYLETLENKEIVKYV